MSDHRSSSPCPARLASGRRTPPRGTTAPSNASRSIRTWSWNHSRWRRFAVAAATARCSCGAQCPDTAAFRPTVLAYLDLHGTYPEIGHPSADLLGQAVVVVGGEAAAAVHRDLDVVRPEQAVQRDSEQPRLEVPQCDVHRRDGAAG